MDLRMKIVAFLAFFILSSCCDSDKKHESFQIFDSILCLGKKEDSKEFKNLINKLDLKRVLLKGEVWYKSQRYGSVFILDKDAVICFVSLPIKSKSIIDLMQKNDMSLFNTFISYHDGVLFCKNNSIKIESQNPNIITVQFNKTIYNFLYTNDNLDEIYIKYQRPTEKDTKRILKDKVIDAGEDNMPSILHVDKTSVPLKIEQKKPQGHADSQL
jgi:hypothetical protein